MHNKKNSANTSLIIGIIGFFSGIGLMLGGNWFIGVFGTIASAALTYKGYQDSKVSKN